MLTPLLSFSVPILLKAHYETRRERQRQGVELAKAAGKYAGRTRDLATHRRIVALRTGGQSIQWTAELAGCSKNQVKRIWAMHRDQSQRQHYPSASGYRQPPEVCSPTLLDALSGRGTGGGEMPFPPLLRMAAAQIKVPVEHWSKYGHRDQTRREHQIELQSVFGFQPFALRHYRSSLHSLDDLALQTDKGVPLATALVESLRSQAILLPSLRVIDRLCAESITRGNRKICRVLTESLSDAHRAVLDNLLKLRPQTQTTTMAWLRQSPAAANAKHLLEHIEHLKLLRTLDLPDGIERRVHQNRSLKIEGWAGFGGCCGGKLGGSQESSYVLALVQLTVQGCLGLNIAQFRLGG